MTTATTTPAGKAPADELVFDVRGITLRFGGVTSLNDVSLQMRRGEILAVIGPNGAGKTSLFNSLTGVYTPQEGEVLVAARSGDEPVSVLGKKTHVVNHLGVARTFQNIRLFSALTALENVKVGIETRQKSGPISAMLGLPWQRREEKDSTAKAYQLLDRVGLAGRANELAGSLAYGEQRRLEIARALGTGPGVILLDEPAAGTNPVEKRELAALIQQINADGVAVLLIEHDMKLVMSVAHRILVLNFGQRIAEGTPEQIQRDPAVVAAYLGTSEEDAETELATHDQPELQRIDLSGDPLHEASTTEQSEGSGATAAGEKGGPA
ncbi:amino acid/amide ABC transporter ATP-binding protein 1, HAAT family (TC 3.A.1.4.-) [Klenkia soli]|uniref:Amino acid/amide ABC transporter ATP-binding protein 1, HAAT family (TC 3.A.1.4.-) n=1 Tax=Klenkia soli TaxID=1052260 RepID=A0A1H0M072_9ACTN|nr:ABC transporter ATP-binding protein [Klenkia soli]SDO73606.1 amino acid/amide ABC transporter ATP-binding protein 1, HAAT family (TC 3.A.1.4.-) [Klenkia soli]